MPRHRKAIKRQHSEIYTLAENKVIEKYPNRHGISKSEIVRAKSLNHRLGSRLTQEEADYYRKLKDLANNLNQFA